MSAQMLRSVASPTRSALKNASVTKSIFKRPASLPLSPNPMPLANTVNIVISPAPKSAHVRFPTSANLVSVFSAHSPNTYDRAAIVVSPNPLALPAWGDRIYSPSTNSFKTSEAKKQAGLNRPVLSVSFKEGDLLTVPGKAAVAPEPSKTRAGARFRENLAQASQVLPRDTSLGTALAKFPRSPYPSAPPLSPAAQLELTSEASEASHRRASMSEALAPVKVSRPASLTVPRAGTPTVPKVSFATVNANSTVSSALSPVPESPALSVSPETRLSNAFWNSMTMEQPKSILKNSASRQAAEELDVPVSAVPKFVFGTKDGALWSPGLPRKEPVAQSLLSPSVGGSFGPATKEFRSPTPNDPFAAFPSFSSVLTMSESVTYPASVVQEASA